MTAFLPTYASKAKQTYDGMKSKYFSRDNVSTLVYNVRAGQMRGLFPEELVLDITFDGVPIANFIDNVARDLAENLAPLPSLACTSGSMATDADKQRATMKNWIGDNYWAKSLLEVAMNRAADNYFTYGFAVFYVEPRFDCKLPFIGVDESRYSYYELNRYGKVKYFANRKLKSVDELCAEWPEWEYQIRNDPKSQSYNRETPGDTLLEMVRWVDDQKVMLFLPQRDGLVLGQYEHKMSGTPVVIVERPGTTEIPRGQFDDVVWVQVARGVMSLLALQAAHTAVTAPIAAPEDMDEFPLGANAILQSQNANQIRRVNLELPVSTFAETQNLDAELRTGSRYPDARMGGSDASVITGRGVDALMSGYNSQLRNGQLLMKYGLQDITAMAFEMDEKWWPNESRKVNGTVSGESYEFSYTPARHINGRYDCTVTYGFANGLSPSQSIVTMLQLEGAGLIAKGTTRENLPMPIDAQREQQKIDVERVREALEQSLFAFMQSSGPLAANGQDPLPVIKLGVDVTKALHDGKAIEDAIQEAYEAMQQAKEAEMQQQMAAAQAAQGGGGAGVEGVGVNGLPTGVAPGQAGQPAGGLPTVADMAAGFRGNGNLPVNSFTIRRRTAV